MVNATVETRKALWSSAGNRCAYSSCNQHLVADLRDPDRAAARKGGVIGEEAHIRSSKPLGPRHDPAWAGDLDAYDNLILLCPTHHTVIDENDGADWPVERVLHMKSDHERLVDSRLGKRAVTVDVDPEQDALLARLSRWEEGLDLAGWDELTKRLNYVVPYVSADSAAALSETTLWLAGMHWPPRWPRLAAAFATQRSLLDTLLRHVHRAFVFEVER